MLHSCLGGPIPTWRTSLSGTEIGVTCLMPHHICSQVKKKIPPKPQSVSLLSTRSLLRGQVLMDMSLFLRIFPWALLPPLFPMLNDHAAAVGKSHLTG